MSEESPVFDPEVVALLQEAVEDPRSAITKVPNEPLHRWIERREAPMSSRETHVLAERHLVQVYRESLARSLYRAAYSRVADEPSWKTGIQQVVDSRYEPLSQINWRDQSQRELDLDSYGQFEEAMLLARFFGSRKGEVPSASQLALASLRLVPRDDCRIVLALALHGGGSPKSAYRILFDVLANRPSALSAALAWTNLGYVENDPYRRMEYNRNACKNEVLPTALVNWFVRALQLGDREEALKAAELLEELGQENDSCISEFLQIVCSKLGPSRFESTLEYARLRPLIEDSLPSSGRRIVDAL